MKCRSEWHNPAYAVRSRISRRFGFSISTSSMVRGWWGAWKTAAFMLVPSGRQGSVAAVGRVRKYYVRVDRRGGGNLLMVSTPGGWREPSAGADRGSSLTE